jgi:hypothetical protein
MALQPPPRLTTPHPAAGLASSEVPDAGTQLVLLTVAGLSVGAAGIHFAVAPAHLAEQALEGYFFVGVAIAQALWGHSGTALPASPAAGCRRRRQHPSGRAVAGGAAARATDR